MRAAAGIFAVASLALLSLVYIAWAIRDARRREKSPILVVIAVVFFFPVGLVAWLLLRPKPHRRRYAIRGPSRPLKPRSL